LLSDVLTLNECTPGINREREAAQRRKDMKCDNRKRECRLGCGLAAIFGLFKVVWLLAGWLVLPETCEEFDCQIAMDAVTAPNGPCSDCTNIITSADGSPEWLSHPSSGTGVHHSCAVCPAGCQHRIDQIYATCDCAEVAWITMEPESKDMALRLGCAGTGKAVPRFALAAALGALAAQY
jgi:hypothetical protein